MNVDLVQLLYYFAFALLGWWLRHKGLLRPNGTPPPPLPIDQKGLVELLRALLDRLAQPPAGPTNPAPPAAGNRPPPTAGGT